MPKQVPVITIQSDWNDVIRTPYEEAWISSKRLNEQSIDETFKTSVNKADNKLKIKFSKNFQYISHTNLNLVVKHVSSGVKAAFVTPTKDHCVHSKAILSVHSAENALVVSSCEDHRLLVWDSRTNEVLLDLKGHGGPVYKCRFFPSGIVVISAGADGSCRIWSAESGINPVTLAGHKMAITDLTIVEKGRNVISVSKDGFAKLWDVGKSRCLANIVEGYGQINCCATAITSDNFTVGNEREVGTSNKLLVVGCESGLVICMHVARRLALYYKQLDSPCNACVVLDQCIIMGCANGKLVHLNLRDGVQKDEWYESASPVLSLAALPNKLFIVGRQDGTCTVISVRDAHCLIRVQLTGSDCDGIRDIAFNGKWIFTGSRDSIIRKYDYNQVYVHFK